MKSSLRRAVGTVAAGAAAVGMVALMGAGAVADSASRPRFPMPEPYGTTFQKDPQHDFSKRIRPRHDGILRGWVYAYDAKEHTAEYAPIKWVKRTKAFVAPGEYDVMRYSSRVSPKAVLYSARDCDSTKVTVDSRGLGTKKCGKSALLAHLRAGERPAMITVYRGEIVKIQEIYERR
ncbi:hypothetical protein AB0K60_03495 [Thermopolyspora sp. NPDC052614]|uniref:hypothetical protein n=1 Tax=Thermopolyspora sp. NPDC052614 TaxID=3155682 RepID=UPI0034451359